MLSTALLIDYRAKIPSEINGYEVKSIDKFIPCIYENGFSSGEYAETVKGIYIPDTVRLEADLPIAEHAEKLRFPQDSSISGVQVSSLYAELKTLVLPNFADDDSEVVCNLTTNPGK